jgi:hypothetical protein
MTDHRPGGQNSDHLAEEQFLVDGVAPSVIGEGPPESSFDVAPDPEPRARYAPEQRQEPPTSPIPVLRPALPRTQQQEKRKSWVAKMFRPGD